MKKIIVFSLVFLLLCGCARIRPVKPVLKNISFTAEIQCENINCVVDGITSDSGLKLTVKEPEKIEGLMFEVDKNGVTAGYKGISYTVDVNTAPKGAVMQAMFDILKDVVNKKIVCYQDNCEIKGSVNGHEYSFLFSPQGLPISVEVEDINLSVTFSNVTINK